MIASFHSIRAKLNENGKFSKFPEIFLENSVIPGVTKGHKTLFIT